MRKPMVAVLTGDCFGRQAAPFLFLTIAILRFLTGTTVFVVGALILIIPGQRLQRAPDRFYHVFAAAGSFSNAPWRELAVRIEDQKRQQRVDVCICSRNEYPLCVIKGFRKEGPVILPEFCGCPMKCWQIFQRRR